MDTQEQPAIAGADPAPGGGTRSGNDGAPGANACTAQERFFGAVRGLGAERAADRWFTGVCAGLAHRFGVDPVVVRALFAALTVAGGLGLALYGVAWLLLPGRDGRIEAERALRGDVSGAAVAAGVLVVLDLATGQGVFAWESWGAAPGWGVLITFLALAGVWWLLRDRLPQFLGGSQPNPPRWVPRAAAPTAAGDVAAPAGETAAPRLSLRKEHPADAPAAAAAEDAAEEAAEVPWWEQPGVPPAVQRAQREFEKARKEFQRGREQFSRGAEKAALAVAEAERRRLAAERRKRERALRRRPGSPLLTTAVVGLALVVAGAVVLADRVGVLPGHPLPLALAAATFVTGVGALLAGLRGRRGGGDGLGWVLAVLAALTALVPMQPGPLRAGEQWWTPDGTDQARSVLVGDFHVSTEDLARSAGGAAPQVEASLGTGRLVVAGAAEQTVLVVTRVATGRVEVDAPGARRLTGPEADRVAQEYAGEGAGEVRSYVVGEDAAQVAQRAAGVASGVDAVVVATVGAGQVLIAGPGSAPQVPEAPQAPEAPVVRDGAGVTIDLGLTGAGR
ncbi:PspC domain-containing protein [Kineococcus glutinatus]|uniref:Phage shock protein PspC N-terminal domain-containing protein n=1 Tax=Kineococcus glutinatus TaxID=1070872 RepID=A0ABP9HSA6_9ACTN